MELRTQMNQNLERFDASTAVTPLYIQDLAKNRHILDDPHPSILHVERRTDDGAAFKVVFRQVNTN